MAMVGPYRALNRLNLRSTAAVHVTLRHKADKYLVSLVLPARVRSLNVVMRALLKYVKWLFVGGYLPGQTNSY